MPCSSLITSQNCRRKSRQGRPGRAGLGAPPSSRRLPPPPHPHRRPPARRSDLGSDLVSALPGLQVHDLPHDGGGTAHSLPTPLFPQPTVTAREDRQALYSSGMRAQPSFPRPGGHPRQLLATRNEALKMRKSGWMGRCHSNQWLLFAPPSCLLILLLSNGGPRMPALLAQGTPDWLN